MNRPTTFFSQLFQSRRAAASRTDLRRARRLAGEPLEARSLLSGVVDAAVPLAPTVGEADLAAAMAMPMLDSEPAAAAAEEVTWGLGLTDPGEPSAWDITGMPLGEFHSRLTFVKRATVDPLLAPGNPDFWHAHDFFVNPSVDENSTLESLLAAGETAAAPTNNLSTYWVPSLFNEATGQYVDPLDSSIAYYSVQKPLEPSKIEAMPAGLSIIAGSAMPTERQSTAVVFWNYIGTPTQYDHIPQGELWQDLPLQAVIMFPQFWDGASLTGSNFKDHMAYDRGGDGGPSSHPYLLPELQLQIHYGRIPQDARLVLTSDSMTADRPGYAPGWSMHADFIHTPWPERDAEGNLYDGFERRVNDNLRWPTVAGTDGNAARTNPRGLEQPFTPAPIILDPVLPAAAAEPGQPPEAEPPAWRVVEAVGGVSLLEDPATGRGYLQEAGGQPLPLSRQVAAGDADLNGRVDAFDLIAIASAGSYNSGGPADWSTGDFTLDGTVDIFDLVAAVNSGLYAAGEYPAIDRGLPPQPVPITRGGWTLLAAERNGPGQLMLLESRGQEYVTRGVDATGLLGGAVAADAQTLPATETLFGLDLDGDGQIGPVTAEPPAASVSERAFWEPMRGIGFSVGSAGSLTGQDRLEDALRRVVDLGFNTIRTWGAGDYTGRILEAIDRLGLPLKVQVGIWIATDAGAESLIADALAVIEPFREHVLAVSLGNEQLADWNSSDLTVDQLLGQVAFFREQSDLPLTYNFSGETFRPWSSFWNQDGGRLLAALDFLNVHSYAGFFDNRFNPAWTPERQLEVLRADEALFAEMLADLGMPDKPLILGETGWQGSGYDPAVTNPANMQAYYEAATRYVYGPAARFDGMFYFNFSDEAWKGGDDHWGLFAEGGAAAVGPATFALAPVPEILDDAGQPTEPALEVVAATGDVRLLVDPASGLAHIQAGDAEPLVIRRNDSYWSGAIPLTRGTASLVAAARDDLGRLRVLDVSEWGYFAWILDEAGMFVGEEQFDAASLAELESLFGTDLG